MAKAAVTVNVSEIHQVAALITAARAVRDELSIRGDHGVSAAIERQLSKALKDLGV